MIIENKRGRFKKLIEDLDNSNIEMIDVSVTTMEGAYLITATLKVTLYKLKIRIIFINKINLLERTKNMNTYLSFKNFF
jgi:hypothetical protein